MRRKNCSGWATNCLHVWVINSELCLAEMISPNFFTSCYRLIVLFTPDTYTFLWVGQNPLNFKKSFKQLKWKCHGNLFKLCSFPKFVHIFVKNNKNIIAEIILNEVQSKGTLSCSVTNESYCFWLLSIFMWIKSLNSKETHKENVGFNEQRDGWWMDTGNYFNYFHCGVFIMGFISATRAHQMATVHSAEVPGFLALLTLKC